MRAVLEDERHARRLKLVAGGGEMRVVVGALVISLSSAGCGDVVPCLLVHAPAFSVALCETPSEEPIISGDNACAEAQFECTTESPCTGWVVFSRASAGICTVRVDVAGESDSLSFLLYDTGCGVRPDREASEPYRIGPGCELDDGR